MKWPVGITVKTSCEVRRSGRFILVSEFNDLALGYIRVSTQMEFFRLFYNQSNAWRVAKIGDVMTGCFLENTTCLKSSDCFDTRRYQNPSKKDRKTNSLFYF